MATTTSTDSASIEHGGSMFTGARLVYSFLRHETAPPRFVQFLKGSLVLNSDASAFIQQDRLLTSWLLSIINSSLLSSFTEARTMCDVWNTATCLFAAVTGTKLSQLRHDLKSSILSSPSRRSRRSLCRFSI